MRNFIRDYVAITARLFLVRMCFQLYDSLQFLFDAQFSLRRPCVSRSARMFMGANAYQVLLSIEIMLQVRWH